MHFSVRQFIRLLVAAIIVGLAIFALFYFVLRFDINEALLQGVIAGVTGLVIEYVRPYFIKLDKAQQNQISNRVRRNLKR